ncbi:hypothetical protein N7489_000811 [Penicillium chrysogenum]|uniref:Uncharacterized protein n=1 Tax=Penicillium chrysogenum TaxID=5076 RepID=A0ABQ8WGV9_PENCH|nr:uncharacterized protein N7489_000811 [Penicillium chrysogenum]KAJ5250401.1 hypothetical protein N7489_000811 [Penicillium chrysogenum]KAJ5269303.1 hypothetical protein N7505_005061 [Penicillium chrysogenum]
MAGSKKAKAKDKNSKAATKKVKKGKSPEVTETQTTTTTPAPGSPELTAQEPEQVKDQEPAVDNTDVEVKSPLPVSAYEVFDDETTPQDSSNPVADQETPVHDNPVSKYEVLDDKATPQHTSDPVAGPQSPVLDKPVSEYQVFDDETAPQDILDPVLDQSSPVVDKPVDEASPLDEPRLTQPPIEDTEVKQPVDELSSTEPPIEDTEVKQPPVDEPSSTEPTFEDKDTELKQPPVDEPSSTEPTFEDKDTELKQPPVDGPSSTEPPLENTEIKEPPAEEASSVQPPLEDTEAKEPLEDQPKQDQPKQAERSEETTVVSSPPADPFSPVAACVPLPSPSLTEARYMSSPSQDNQLYYPGPSAYSPYASPVPYSAPAPYASPNAYASPVPYAASPVPYASPNAYSSPVPYTSPALHAPVPYAGSPVHYTSTPYAGSPVPYSLPGPYAGSPAAYASPVAQTASPVPKVSSPLARSHYPQMSPTISPRATPPPQNPPAAPMAPSEAPSVAQSGPYALQSPVMSSAGMVPPYGHYSPHHQSEAHYMHNMHRSYSIPDPSYSASYQALQNLSMANGHSLDNGSPPENDSEHIELLQRIQSAIPDINRLLHGFRSTHNKLSTREAEMKHIGSQHDQALMHKDYYIEALQAQMKKTANESAEEDAKLKHTISELRLELGDLQEKQKDLEDGLAVHQKSNEELTETKVQLEGQINQLNESIKESKEAHEKALEAQREEQEKALVAQKEELTELFEEIKAEDEKTAAENLETRERELRSEHEANKNEWEKEKAQLQESFETQRTELEATKTEVTSQIAALESKETELQARLAELTSTREELAAKLAELEELRQGHAGELDSMRQSHDEQLAAAAKELDEKIAALEAHFNEKEKLWTTERAAMVQQLSEKDSELASAEREKERLEGDGIVKEQHLQRAVDGMRMTIDNLGSDCDRLRKTLLSLGEATDLRNTKGDQFFLDCFTELSQLIHNLSKEHFGYLPIDPPKDILSKIPSELPPFLDNTPASRELRCAYIQHIISKTLTFRVFQPFLFTLGRRYDKADTFFQMLSMDIRRKSVRREAFWRQQTLKAAYTTSDAKQSINVAAAVIVDEIIDHIKHFADPKHLDSLLVGVRKIVKLAAETWRHARVERELVLASFPAPDAESVSNEGWLEYAANKDQKNTPSNEPTRHVVLRTFPRITREAAHEDFASDEEKATGCTYSQGVVLYSDSPVIMGRLQEFAKNSADAVVTDSPPKTPLGAKGIEKLAPIDVSSPKVMTVRSAPTSPGAKGQFMRT